VCPTAWNTNDVDFRDFTVFDGDDPSHVFFSSKRPPTLILPPPHLRPDDMRVIIYDFDKSFLSTPHIQAVCDFSVGNPGGSSSVKELPPLRMIERHYFRDTLLGSYDFTFGPLSTPSLHNKWEFKYDMPALTTSQIDEMISDPYSLSSDSFYFLGSDLILHHKAFYAFKAQP